MKYAVSAAMAAYLFFCGAVRAETTLRFLSSFDSRYAATPIVADLFSASIKQASNGTLQTRTFGPEVVPPFEQFEPVSKGAFDLLFTAQPYHIGVTSVSQGIHALDGDVATWRRDGIFDFVDKHYARFNIKLLAILPTTTEGAAIGAYQALLKDPVRPGEKPLAGRKIRGTPTYQPLIEAMGASTVTLSGTDIYPGLQRGTIEGVFWPVIGAVDFKWYEVAPYAMRPTFGTAIHLLLMNLDKFRSLTPDEQKILLTESGKLEMSVQNALEARLAKEVQELTRLGVKETAIDPAIAAPLFETFKQGFWKTAEGAKSTSEEAKEFHAFARLKGLAK